VNLTDSHVHFWDQGNLPYPWLADVPAIAGRHTPAELKTEAGPTSPSRIVFVECGAPWLDEVKWLEWLAAAEPRIAGVVAHVPMNAGARTTAAIAELTKHPLVRGVRHLFQDETDPGFCLTREFIAGIEQLPAAGLSFDICCRHFQLPAVIELVRRCSQTLFILDHAGKPAIRAGLLDPWRAHIRALAAQPNLLCKLSGLVTEADPERWTIEHLRPYVAHLFDIFGPSRLLFGSDWPVAKTASTYRRWVDAAHALTDHLPGADQTAIFADNAARVYRLGA
jgi:L-fuconolactonase